jgi:hypothetical protein
MEREAGADGESKRAARLASFVSADGDGGAGGR